MISCIWSNNEDPEKYVADCYKKETYMKAYRHQIHPLNPIEQWPKTGTTPMEMPPNRSKPGRPRKLRRVEPDEVLPPRGATRLRRYVLIKCSACGEYGHNMKTCFRRKQHNLVSDLNSIIMQRAEMRSNPIFFFVLQRESKKKARDGSQRSQRGRGQSGSQPPSQHSHAGPSVGSSQAASHDA